MGIMVKSSKTLQDAVSSVMQNHHLKPQEALVTMVSVWNVWIGPYYVVFAWHIKLVYFFK